MTSPPLTLPLSAADRAALPSVVAREWGGDRGIARQYGIDPRIVGAGLLPGPDNVLGLDWFTRAIAACPDIPACERALSELSFALRGDPYFYAIIKEGGSRRVTGWAAVERRTVCEDWPALVPIRSLDITDPRRIAYNDALYEERAAWQRSLTDGAGRDAKREHGERQTRAARGGGR